MTRFVDLPLALVSLVLALHGILVAWLSLRVRDDSGSGWWFVLTGAASTLCWWALARYSRVRLDYASVAYDVVCGSACVVALWYFGKAPTWWQAVGCLLALVGLAAMGVE